MKKILSLLLLCASCAFAQSALRYGTYNVSCSAVTATGPCAYFTSQLFGGYTLPSSWEWSTQVSGTVSTISATLEGSIDGRSSLDGVATASSAALTSASLNFTPRDVGKAIYVGGAGTGGATLLTTISSYVSATQVTMNTTAVVSIVNAPVFLGTFGVMDTSTNTSGEQRAVINYTEMYVRCNVGTLTGAGATVTCGITPKGQ